MKTIEDLRPEAGPLDPEWSACTLQAILAEPGGVRSPHLTPVGGRRRRVPFARQPIGRLIGAAAAVAAVAGVAAAGVAGLRPAPAFAVERQIGGDVVITVIKLSDADGLERALANEGITAEVEYATAVVSSDQDSGGPLACWPGVGDVVVDPADNAGVTITLAADYVAAHDGVLHLTASGGRSADDWIGASVTWC